MGDVKGHQAVLMAVLGDRLGLFRALAEGPGTSSELAERTKLDERYVREWLSGMTCAEYIQYDPASGRFSLAPEGKEVLAREGGPAFLGDVFEELPGLWDVFPKVEQSFREGGGVHIDAYVVLEPIGHAEVEHQVGAAGSQGAPDRPEDGGGVPQIVRRDQGGGDAPTRDHQGVRLRDVRVLARGEADGMKTRRLEGHRALIMPSPIPAAGGTGWSASRTEAHPSLPEGRGHAVHETERALNGSSKGTTCTDRKPA